jgi:deoxyribodipyrimidine photolyase-related protein
MSNFCDNCAYDVEQKEGPKACPFNYLYWDFLLRHQAQLKKNPRMAVAYQTLARFSPTKKKQLQRDAALFLKNLD